MRSSSAGIGAGGNGAGVAVGTGIGAGASTVERLGLGLEASSADRSVVSVDEAEADGAAGTSGTTSVRDSEAEFGNGVAIACDSGISARFATPACVVVAFGDGSFGRLDEDAWATVAVSTALPHEHCPLCSL